MFIPTFNEEDNIANIQNNIGKLCRVFPCGSIYIYDNCSTDKTYALLDGLKVAKGWTISLFRNEENVGFSGNICNVLNIPATPDEFILTLSANDKLIIGGLYKVRDTIHSDLDIDLIVCNWIYRIGGAVPEFMKGDVARTAIFTSLDDYLTVQKYLPNGINQWIFKKKIYRSIADHRHCSCPQLGVFFDAFPCNVYTLSSPTHEVRYIDKSGWRSSAKRIIETHVDMHNEIISHLNRAYDRGKITKNTLHEYSHLVSLIPSQIVKHVNKYKWGTWDGTYQRISTGLKAKYSPARITKLKLSAFLFICRKTPSVKSSFKNANSSL